MKHAIKSALAALGLIEPARFLFNSLRLAQPSVIAEELRFRIAGPPDGFPLPPPRLIFLVIGYGWGSVYYSSGRTVVNHMLLSLERNGVDPRGFRSILDFGCGCGRLIRHVHPLGTGSLHGSDYNSELIDWCQRSLHFGRFQTNNLTPPLQYDDNAFDFIYARSVFTHLGLDLQKAWMAELFRVLRPQGILYFTTHGELLARRLEPEEQQAFDTGKLVVHQRNVEGENLCTTYQSRRFVEENLTLGNTLIAFVPGEKGEHLQQDAYIMRKH